MPFPYICLLTSPRKPQLRPVTEFPAQQSRRSSRPSNPSAFLLARSSTTLSLSFSLPLPLAEQSTALIPDETVRWPRM
ncbi:hypothetical protein M406DRAFT_345035 [Cryphonectria parasitica EP155]|uniref:Uncharacterized protein n=1 Tax=Cryphonectria parasitica (strain ATCC 38755 / EP155) TaxID=660469 RepID=A0A9P4YA77_CRYP1|nr:uncharacterized protein M406DRAFT_345035 [Cryphonectria parasitica EP155]KAF3769259.1 hypothetical protein M406DRAFT_345035 [Cryphonectria parasitica EP155]